MRTGGEGHGSGEELVTDGTGQVVLVGSQVGEGPSVVEPIEIVVVTTMMIVVLVVHCFSFLVLLLEKKFDQMLDLEMAGTVFLGHFIYKLEWNICE